jgi:hypothetical protein
MGTAPDANPAANAAPALPAGRLKLTFEHDNWPLAAGVAMALTRMDKPFCVDQDWGFMFDRRRVCPDEFGAQRLVIGRDSSGCTTACRQLYQGTTLSAMILPVPEANLPVTVGMADTFDRKAGFYVGEHTHRWAQKHAVIRFLLAPQASAGDCLRLWVTGFAGPARPARFALNGYPLGTWSKERLDSGTFIVPTSALRPGLVNVISIDTDKAGPVGADPRQIGFGFVGSVLRAAQPGESCRYDPSTGPEYSSVSADWVSGCYALEGSASAQWRWCREAASLTLRNQSAKTQRVVLSAALSTGHDSPAALNIQSVLFHQTIRINSYPRNYTRLVDLPPGDHAINFSCDAPKAEAPTDPRTMIFRIDRFHAEAEDLPSGRAETGRSQVSPLAGWGPGFYGQEVNGDDTWRWCQSKCELFLENDGSLPAPTLLSATLVTGQNQASDVWLRSSIFSKTYQVSSAGTNILERFALPPGRYRFEFSTSAPRVDAPTDPRVLVLQIRNVQLKSEAAN